MAPTSSDAARPRTPSAHCVPETSRARRRARRADGPRWRHSVPRAFTRRRPRRAAALHAADPRRRRAAAPDGALGAGPAAHLLGAVDSTAWTGGRREELGQCSCRACQPHLRRPCVSGCCRCGRRSTRTTSSRSTGSASRRRSGPRSTWPERVHLLQAVTALDVLGRGRPRVPRPVRSYADAHPRWRGAPRSRAAVLDWPHPWRGPPRETGFRLLWLAGVPACQRPRSIALVRSNDGARGRHRPTCSTRSGLLGEYDGPGTGARDAARVGQRPGGGLRGRRACQWCVRRPSTSASCARPNHGCRSVTGWRTARRTPWGWTWSRPLPQPVPPSGRACAPDIADGRRASASTDLAGGSPVGSGARRGQVPRTRVRSFSQRSASRASAP